MGRYHLRTRQGQDIEFDGVKLATVEYKKHKGDPYTRTIPQKWELYRTTKKNYVLYESRSSKDAVVLNDSERLRDYLNNELTNPIGNVPSWTKDLIQKASDSDDDLHDFFTREV